MSLSIARLRVWLLVGAALLVLVIAGFLGYARYRTHRFLAGLPAKLGVDIRRETNGYTYSQSVQGKTVMTLHAAKAVEHQNGKLTLHDVSIILYGRKHDRADRISGSEFEYDQPTGVVRAVGEVHIDLEAPPHAEATPSPAPRPVAHPPAKPEEENQRVIHVKTSGLVYLQKLGVAATDQNLEFTFGGVTGHAIGAEYNSDTGVLVLQSAVTANGLQHGTPVTLTASHAELERANQRALLTQATYVSPGQTAQGDHAIVHLRSDGSPERIEAEGNVVLKSPTAGNVTAPHADVLLNERSQARSAHLFGGVAYEDATSLRNLREGKGQAEDAQIAFDAIGRPENVVLTGAVHVHERVRATEAASWSVREATAGRMTFALANDSTGKNKELRNAEATAGRLTLVSDAGTPAAVTSELSGDALQGRFTGEGRTAQLSEVQGTGHTFLRHLNALGAEQTSTGDMLEVTLRPASKQTSPGRSNKQGAEEIAKAVQTGHVVLTSKPAPQPGAAQPATTRATADLGVYDGDADHLTLTGHAQVSEESSTVSANKIVMEHTSGDATAEGVVRATYLQPNATEPVHVLADRAELIHASNRAVFYGAGKGTAGRPARLWQGASQVEAPVIDLDQQKRSLNARGDAADTSPMPVHAVLVGDSAAKPGASSHPSVVRVASRTMVYSDSARQVDFAGEVKVEDADGVLHARQATAYLQPAPAAGSAASKKSSPKNAPTGVLFGGSVERIVATGKIEMEQPGRRAAGEQLVYTASDGMFVLTGTPTVLPKLIDEVQGTVTGTTLRFHTGDDSVMVTGAANNPSERVHTVTRVKQK